MKIKSILVVFLFLTSIGSGAALADREIWVDGQNRALSFMQTYGISLPPIGYVRFCEYHPEECKTLTSKPYRQKMSSERWRQLIVINNYVNSEIQPVTDLQLYGQVEHWTYPREKGDCEDYVLLKRRLLMEQGWPTGALLITVVIDEEGEGHAVLTARTSEGDFLLDNKRNEVLAWNSLPYRYVKMQSDQNPQIWTSLRPTASSKRVSAIVLQKAP